MHYIPTMQEVFFFLFFLFFFHIVIVWMNMHIKYNNTLKLIECIFMLTGLQCYWYFLSTYWTDVANACFCYVLSS